MLQTTVPVKNPIIVLLKAILYSVLFQIFMGVSLIIGFIIENKLDLMAENNFNVMIIPNHRILAWTGLTLLLMVLPISGLLAKLVLRSRAPSFYFLDQSPGKLIAGILGGGGLAVAIVGGLLISGHGTIIASPGRLVPQEIWASFLTYGLLMLFVGYYEEIISRGLLMCEWSLCARSWIAGITISGFMFGLVHVFNLETTGPERFRIIVSGILFSWLLAAVTLRFRSLYAAIGVHAGWNFGLGAFMGCIVSGQRLNLTLFQTEICGPEWISGGNFGLETSLIVNGLLVIIIWYLWRGIDLDSLARWRRPEDMSENHENAEIEPSV